jgi:tetratricopeptide (TPR) repeat protein
VGAAEKLLLDNIAGGALTPQSPEWRTSQFELGSLLHHAGRYLDAVKRLEEAVERYPNDPQARLARYQIAESYRHAANEPLEKLATAKTVSENEHLQNLVNQYLGNALRYYGDVQREIAASGESTDEARAMRRNCYMLQGSVLFDLGRYKEAVEAYSNVATLYQNEPFVLETLVQIAHCWNRLHDDVKARGQIEQAKLFLNRLPADADFEGSTNLSRQEWILLLEEMSRWWQPRST